MDVLLKSNDVDHAKCEYCLILDSSYTELNQGLRTLRTGQWLLSLILTSLKK